MKNCRSLKWNVGRRPNGAAGSFHSRKKKFNMHKVILKPFIWYNDVLIKYPLLTKCVTSGVMYASGDVLAQYTENYTKQSQDGKCKEEPFRLNKKRTALFFVFGTIISGPSYHYWFNYLNELPALMWRYKQTKHRGKILRAYAYLKSHGIEVKLDPSKLPNAAPLDKWKGKAAKIAADQLIFSSVYTLVFFLSIGIMEGGVEKLEAYLSNSNRERKSEAPITSLNDPRIIHMVEKLKRQLQKSDQEKAKQTENQTQAIQQEIKNSAHSHHHTNNSHHHKHSSEFENTQLQQKEIQLIQDIVQLVKEYENSSSSSSSQKTEEHVILKRSPSWQEIWDRTWSHTRDVYVQTYLTDCIVWPPLQLINFTFVPLRFQFLFVNVANLAWNTFLSLMANKKEGGGGGHGHH